MSERSELSIVTASRREFQLYPAIDVLAGKVVRLERGDYDAATTYGDDPVEVAESFASAGATWIHVVDLDAARTGDPVNRPVIAAIARAMEGRAAVQTGGGVRSLDDVRVLRDAGVDRVVMGSAAVRDPSLVAAAAKVAPVAVGLDHRDGMLAVDGWTQAAETSLHEALGAYPDASAFVVTDITRDGMLSGPDVVGLAVTAAAADVPVIASGGVATLDDIRALASTPGLAGVIVGKAIYEGRFTVAEALDATRSGR